MIKSIKLKNCATYSPDGVSIENCQRVNFFYGPNGSGKTTISNFLSNQTDPQYGECKIEWENDAALDVVVYNRDFRKNNLKENIPGVFTLGQATIEEKHALEEMEEQRTKKRDDHEKLNNTLQEMRQKKASVKASLEMMLGSRY